MTVSPVTFIESELSPCIGPILEDAKRQTTEYIQATWTGTRPKEISSRRQMVAAWRNFRDLEIEPPSIEVIRKAIEGIDDRGAIVIADALELELDEIYPPTQSPGPVQIVENQPGREDTLGGATHNLAIVEPPVELVLNEKHETEGLVEHPVEEGYSTSDAGSEVDQPKTPTPTVAPGHSNAQMSRHKPTVDWLGRALTATTVYVKSTRRRTPHAQTVDARIAMTEAWIAYNNASKPLTVEEILTIVDNIDEDGQVALANALECDSQWASPAPDTPAADTDEEERNTEDESTVADPSTTAVSSSLPKWARSTPAVRVYSECDILTAEIETRTEERENEATLALPLDVEAALIGILYPDGKRAEDLVWADVYRKYMPEDEKHAVLAPASEVERYREWARTRGITVRRPTVDAKAKKTRPSRANKSMIASAICRCTFKLKMGKMGTVTVDVGAAPCKQPFSSEEIMMRHIKEAHWGFPRELSAKQRPKSKSKPTKKHAKRG